jgi:hypothetical protein
MAEEVIISGVGNGPPDFATEQTQKQIRDALSNIQGITPSQVSSLIKAISNGDKSVEDAIKGLSNVNSKADKAQLDKLTKMRETLADSANLDKEALKVAKEQIRLEKNSLSQLSSLLKDVTREIDANNISIGEGLGIAMAGVAGVAGTVVSAAAGAVTALAAASNAANSFAIQLGEDRFNLANEIRQSGLATTLTNTESSMMGFAEMVNQSSFTLGQAAEFTRDFGRAVGGLGIQRSMQLVEDMAYAGAEGANMMQRFGMDFNQVKNVAGEYLETVRNLGMLDRMNDQQLRSGMMDFMDTVTVTSNILKVNIEEAAKMVANTLAQRDDLTAMLATLPTDLRNNVQNVVAAMGAQGTQFGESIAQFVAAGGMQNFLTTEQGQAVAGSAFGQEFLPILEQIGNQILAGGDLGQILASTEGQLANLIGSAQDGGFAAMIRQNADPMIRELLSDLIRMQDTIGDANAGNRADTTRTGLEDDRAFVDRAMVAQEQALALDNVLNALGKAFDYGENLTKLNAANLALIQELEQTIIPAIDTVAPSIAAGTVLIQESLTNLATVVADAVGVISRVLPGDQGARQAEIAAENSRARDTLGLTQEEFEARSQAEIQRMLAAEQARQEQFRRDIETGDGLTRRNTSDQEIERVFQQNFNRQIDEYTLEDGSTEYRMSHGPGMYAVLSEELATRLKAERETRQTMYQNRENYDDISAGDAQRLISSLLGSTNGSIDSEGIIDFLGVNNTSRQLGNVSYENGELITDDSRFEFFNDALEEMQRRGGLPESQVQQIESLIAQIAEMNTTYRFGFDTEGKTERETADKNRLTVAIEQLVNELRSN